MLATTRLAKPGTASGENATILTPLSAAASIAGPEHHIRAQIADHLRGARDGARQRDERLRARLQAHILERADFHEVERIPGVRHKPRLNPALGADERDLGGVALAQLLCDGKRGNHVAAGAAACEEDFHWSFPR